MHSVQIQLSDQMYDRAMQRASESGMSTVEEFLAEVVSDELAPNADNLDDMFTTERLQHIDAVISNVRAGEKTLSVAEARAQLKAHAEARLNDNAQ